MAEVLCPKCGKPNPDELENCQFCQASLQPSDGEQYLQPGESPVRMDTDEFENTQVDADNEPIRPGELPTKKNTSELEQVLPSWLRAARGVEDGKQSAEEQSASPPIEGLSAKLAAGSSEEEIPDWLAGLDANAGGDEGEEVPDWLANLRGEAGSEPPAEDESPQESDLFSKIQASEAEGLPAEPETTGSDMPDWLSSLKSAGQSFEDIPFNDAGMHVEPEPSQADDEMPDWLAGLKSEGQIFADAAETPWGEVETPTEAVPSQTEGEIPDWLAGLKPEEQMFADVAETPLGEVETPAESEPSAVQEEIPDWLVGLKSEEQSFPERAEIPSGFADIPVEPEPALPEGELPDWLAAMKPEGELPSEISGTASSDLPDWLHGLEDAKDVSSEETAGGVKPPSEVKGEVPDWLASAQPEPAQDDFGSSLEPSSSGPSEPVPDWLTGLQDDADQVESKPEDKPAFEYASTEFSPSESEPAEALPGWLEGIASGASSSGSQPALIEGDESEITSEQPDEDFSLEAPDWLSTLEPEKKSAKSTSAFVQDNAPDEALEPGELPSWVQAMRPVESAVGDIKAQEVDEQIVESQGPLAGLSGVLPAEPGLGPLRKPPAYSIKLHTNESQQRHAAHLEKMVAAESQAGKVGKSAGIFSTRILRWVIAAILLIAVVFPTILGSQSVPAFLGYPSEMGPTINQIDALPINPPVLIVFDYQPAFVGEMNAAAGPLMDYLIITKGARLTMVSTIPTGPALAEWFMQSTQAVHGYQAGQQYINLGYISGGTAGVIGFIQNPVTATPVLFNQQSVWGLPPLEGVQSLGDFSMLIVLTDNADTGRVWVEQAAQYLETTPPMVMVVSAQAEPMIRPYFDAGQIQGLVVGLAGGKSLEAITRPGLGQAYWDAFSYGLLVAEILILVGGIWSAISGIRSRQIKLEEGEA
jgi:hypothetical protein